MAAPSMVSGREETTAPPIAVIVAIAFLGGMGAAAALDGVDAVHGWSAADVVLRPRWAALATVALVGASAVLRRSTIASRVDPGRHLPSMARICLALALVPLGAGWYAAAAQAPGMPLPVDGRLVCVRGIVVSAPVIAARTRGPMARFDRRPVVTRLELALRAFVDADGAASPVSGHLLVRVDAARPDIAAGDALTCTGWIRPPGGARNPGGLDWRTLARRRRIAGSLTVTRPDLARVESPSDAEGEPISRRLHATAARLRAGALARLLAESHPHDHPQRAALIATLFLGIMPDDRQALDAFRSVGLAHLLAISGLHLGVLALVVSMIAGFGGRRAWHGWLLPGVALGFLTLVEPRTPVLRAALMLFVAGTARVAGRNLSAMGLLAVSAIALALWRPLDIAAPGFQLSFGVVAALLITAPRLRRRWFGRPDVREGTLRGRLREGLRSAWAASITAWVVSAPSVLFHFGVLAPLTAPLTIIATPIVAAVLVAGFCRLFVGGWAPVVDDLLALVLITGLDVLLAIVTCVGQAPGASIPMGPAPMPWTIVATVAAVAWTWGALRGVRLLLATLLVVGWLGAATWPASTGPCRLTMLDVGDGSCLVVQSGRRTMLWDAGSLDDLDAAAQRIAPALTAMGVRRIDLLALTHADLDHVSAAADLADLIPIDTVLVTVQLVRAARERPGAVAAVALRRLGASGIRLEVVHSGHRRALGAISLAWLHPAPHVVETDANERSMVVLARVAGRHILLTGDIEARAMARVEARLAALGTPMIDVLELPHHGSWTPAARAFVDRLAAGVVLQSTGPMRWRRSDWASIVPTTTSLLVTARDGACVVEIDEQGVLEARPWAP